MRCTLQSRPRTGNRVELSDHRFWAECSDKGLSTQYLRPNLRPIYHEYLGTSASLLLTRGTTPALKEGTNQPNVVAVVAQGNILDLYINQQHIVYVHDGHRSSGQIGLVADASGAAGPSEVGYRNMHVWSL